MVVVVALAVAFQVVVKVMAKPLLRLLRRKQPPMSPIPPKPNRDYSPPSTNSPYVGIRRLARLRGQVFAESPNLRSDSANTLDGSCDPSQRALAPLSNVKKDRKRTHHEFKSCFECLIIFIIDLSYISALKCLLIRC